MQPQTGRWDGVFSRGKEDSIRFILYLEAKDGALTGRFTVAAPPASWRGPREGQVTGRYTEFGCIQLQAEYGGITASFLGSFSTPGPNAGTMQGEVLLTSPGRPSAVGVLAAIFLPQIDRFLSFVW
jgi:hypothetical protein